ncbi:hypothetical protein IKF76_01135 [Candidatus Saccharibacteria bacterium]|nr:hypothetical protein [Candidatus Saccharibacteria bacterium]
MKINRSHARSAKKIAVIVIAVATIIVAGSVWFNQYFSPAGRAGRELKALTKDYYENFFYDLVIREGGEGKDLTEIFTPYAEYGMQPVLLRQLLLFDNGRHESSRKEFINDSYRCDTNATSVQITPVAPYGRSDWTAEYNLSCENK